MYVWIPFLTYSFINRANRLQKRERWHIFSLLHHLRTDSTRLLQDCIICAQVVQQLSQDGTTCAHLISSRHKMPLLVDR
jgi:hypothetical protein